MFKVTIGDLFESHAQTLVNTVNCVGVMGKGIAQEFKRRFPEMYEDYKQRCERKEVRLGCPYLYQDASGKRIVNFPTKNHWRSPARLVDIERGLDYLVDKIAEWAVTSVAMPPLGCGNGGLEWSEVGPLIYRKLRMLPVDVELFAPFGTPKHQLSSEYLGAPSQLSLDGKGRKQRRLNPDWIALMEVLRELERQPYANPVGRTIFQKICYVVTEMGVPTGLQFDRGSYGPFSDDVKDVLHDFANRNWLQEKQLGRMMSLHVSAQYEHDRPKFEEQIELHRKRVSKAVDLFSRIKSTEQAEEVLTVLYASRQLKEAKQGEEVAEQQLYEYVLNWKKAWRKDDTKKHALANAIRNLVLLGWMRLRISETMTEFT